MRMTEPRLRDDAFPQLHGVTTLTLIALSSSDWAGALSSSIHLSTSRHLPSTPLPFRHPAGTQTWLVSLPRCAHAALGPACVLSDPLHEALRPQHNSETKVLVLAKTASRRTTRCLERRLRTCRRRMSLVSQRRETEMACYRRLQTQQRSRDRCKLRIGRVYGAGISKPERLL